MSAAVVPRINDDGCGRPRAKGCLLVLNGVLRARLQYYKVASVSVLSKQRSASRSVHIGATVKARHLGSPLRVRVCRYVCRPTARHARMHARTHALVPDCWLLAYTTNRPHSLSGTLAIPLLTLQCEHRGVAIIYCGERERVEKKGRKQGVARETANSSSDTGLFVPGDGKSKFRPCECVPPVVVRRTHVPKATQLVAEHYLVFSFAHARKHVRFHTTRWLRCVLAAESCRERTMHGMSEFYRNPILSAKWSHRTNNMHGCVAQV
uniref:Uncharacterized protein n=1 Tax=Setaria digitata TaxID=48799 RepID=A0A915PID7_9BILA